MSTITFIVIRVQPMIHAGRNLGREAGSNRPADM
jgi:hypothetical protein